MKKKLPKIIVITGPTATGKSALAVEVAKRFDGEIISADSRQVYKGLDLGSGKITKKEMCAVPHHLLDVTSPKKRYSVVDFKKNAEKKIGDILKRKKVPILCGGTGFYIDAVVRNIVLPDIKPNPTLRKKLELQSAADLMSIIRKLDPKRAKALDPFNKRRIIRAIEIAKALGSVPPAKKHVSQFNALTIGLTIAPDTLRKRIKNRLTDRLKLGMVREVARLHKKGLSWKRLDELGLEYRFISKFLAKEISESEMITKLETEIYRFSKRQMTWLRGDKSVVWFPPTEESKIFKKIGAFLP